MPRVLVDGIGYDAELVRIERLLDTADGLEVQVSNRPPTGLDIIPEPEIGCTFTARANLVPDLLDAAGVVSQPELIGAAIFVLREPTWRTVLAFASSRHPGTCLL